MMESRSRRVRRQGALGARAGVLALVLLVSASNVSAQATITWDLQGEINPRTSLLIEQTPAWLARLQPLRPENVAVKSVLDMSERAVRMALDVSPGRFQGAVTSAEKDGDILFAAWSLDEAGGPGTLAVWDTPRYTTFLFVWNRLPFAGARDAEAFTRHILPSNGRLADLRLWMRWDSQESRLDALGRSPTAAKLRGEEIQILGLPAQNGSYVYSITLGKVLVSQAYYTGDPSDYLYVAERFPPLRERIGRWTNQRLIGELNDGNSFFATNRDEILLTELLRRGISAGEFRQLFEAPGPFRVEHVMRTLANTHRIAQYGGGLRDMLLLQAPGLHRSEETIRVALQYLKKSPEVDVCDVVSQFLARGAFAPWTFYYMEQRGHTREHYQAVERAVLPAGVPGVERDRRSALVQVGRRLPGLGGRGAPPPR